MKSRFKEWYTGVICKQLDDGIEEVDMGLSEMKSFSAQSMIDLHVYYYLKSHSEIIING